MNKESKIRKNDEFQRIFKTARWVSGRWATIHYRNGEGKRSRWGIVISKRIGGAVVRNKVRRRLREICANLDAALIKKVDLVVVGRKGIEKANYWDLQNDLEQVCRRAKLIEEGVAKKNRKN